MISTSDKDGRPGRDVQSLCHVSARVSIWLSQVSTHLREKYQLPEELQKGLTHYDKHQRPYKLADTYSVPPSTDGSDIHLKLQLHDGYIHENESWEPWFFLMPVSVRHNKYAPRGTAALQSCSSA